MRIIPLLAALLTLTACAGEAFRPAAPVAAPAEDKAGGSGTNLLTSDGKPVELGGCTSQPYAIYRSFGPRRLDRRGYFLGAPRSRC